MAGTKTNDTQVDDTDTDDREMDEQRTYDYSDDNDDENKFEDDESKSHSVAEQQEIDSIECVDVIDCDTHYLAPSSLDPKQDKNVIKIVAISDTHNLHDKLQNIPAADLLVHTGDFTMDGAKKDVKKFVEWVSHLIKVEKKFDHCILIAGNHEYTLDDDYCANNAYYKQKKQQKQIAEIKQMIEGCNGISYLKDSAVTLHGITFFGTPYQPMFFDMAFNLEKDSQELIAKWNGIPEKGVDVLLTHSPPKYHGDFVGDVDYDEGEFVGCKHLLQRVKEIANIQYHVFGHVHEGYGVTKYGQGLQTVFINAAMVNRDLKPVHKPIMFYMQKKAQF